MKKMFKRLDGELVDAVEYEKIIREQHPNVTLYLGTDSQDGNGKACFATVLAFRYGKSGVHILYRKETMKRFKSAEERLRKEIQMTLEYYQYFLENFVKIDFIEFDFNSDNIKKTRSMKFVNEARGYSGWGGCKSLVKPDELIATKAADTLCR